MTMQERKVYIIITTISDAMTVAFLFFTRLLIYQTAQQPPIKCIPQVWPPMLLNTPTRQFHSVLP